MLQLHQRCGTLQEFASGLLYPCVLYPKCSWIQLVRPSLAETIKSHAIACSMQNVVKQRKDSTQVSSYTIRFRRLFLLQYPLVCWQSMAYSIGSCSVWQQFFVLLFCSKEGLQEETSDSVCVWKYAALEKQCLFSNVSTVSHFLYNVAGYK